MFGKAITLFKMFGFSVRADASWLVILVLVIWSLAGAVFPSQFKDLDQPMYWIMGLAGAIGLFASIVFHELSHSLVARRYGLQIKGITLFIFGGVAEMADEPPSPRAEFAMAIAGPIFSLVAGGVFLAAAYGSRAAGWPGPVGGVLHWLGTINILLAIFNLIPGFPLDGGRVLRSILWHLRGDLRRATRAASRVGAGFGMTLIILGFASLLLLRDPVGGLWWILIGMFLRAAAHQSYQQVLMRQALAGLPVRRFMNTQPVTVSPQISLQQLVEDYIYRFHYKMFPVVEGDRLIGCVSTRNLQQVPRDQWPNHVVREVEGTCADEITVSPETDALEALSLMSRSGSSRLLVVENDHLVGLLSLKDLMSVLSLKMELENPDEAPKS